MDAGLLDVVMAPILMNTTRQVGGAVGLADPATVADGAHTLTAGYDRAFILSTALALITICMAFILPKQTKPQSWPGDTQAVDNTVDA